MILCTCGVARLVVLGRLVEKPSSRRSAAACGPSWNRTDRVSFRIFTTWYVLGDFVLAVIPIVAIMILAPCLQTGIKKRSMYLCSLTLRPIKT